jgi:hypothetical protein
MQVGIASISGSLLCVTVAFVPGPMSLHPVNNVSYQTVSNEVALPAAPVDNIPLDNLEDWPSPEEPWLAEPHEWESDFNDLQVNCYYGSMSSCDAIWLNDRLLSGTWLYDYGFLCGNRIRADTGNARRMRHRLFGTAPCTEIFPGND